MNDTNGKDNNAMTEIKIKQGAVITIELPGLAAVRIDTATRTVAVDGISGMVERGETCWPAWRVADLQHGTYGDFHRLRPAAECNDLDCRNSGQHTSDDSAPCSDCGRPVDYINEPWYAIDSGGICATCGPKRYGDRAAEYLIS